MKEWLCALCGTDISKDIKQIESAFGAIEPDAKVYCQRCIKIVVDLPDQKPELKS